MLAALALRPSIAPESVRDFFSFGSARTVETSTTVAAPPKPAKPAISPSDWSKLQTSDLRELVARLRAAGFPASQIRAIIAAEIDQLYAPRFRELAAKIWSPQFWKSDNVMTANSKNYADITALYRERSKLQRSILGDGSLPETEEATAAQKRRFGDLPKAKIDLVQQIEDDYSEMTAQVRAGMQGITLPEDRDKLALLDREKHADLASVLSPDELADYEMRTSNVTSRLRPALTIMDATDQEFRTIYGVENPYANDLYPTGMVAMNSSTFERQRELQQTVNDQLKTALGDSRYADFVRANDRDYQQLYRLSKLDNLPLETANQAYAMRATVAADSTQIANDPNRSTDDKRAALRTLAQNTRVQLNTVLGQDAGTAYASSALWLRYLDNGAAVSFNANGQPVFRPIRPAMSTPKG